MKVLKYLTYYKKSFIGIIIFAILIAILGSITPFLSANVVTSVTDFNVKNIIIFSIIFSIVSVLNNIINNSYYTKRNILQNKASLKLKNDFFKKLYTIQTKCFDKEGIGFFINRIDREPNMIFYNLFFSIDMILELFSVIGVLVYLFIVSYELGIFLVVMSCLSILIDIISNKIRKKHNKEIEELNDSYFNNFSEFIRGIKDIKILNIKNKVINKINNQNLNKFEKNFTYRKQENKFQLIISIIENFAQSGCLLLGIYLVYLNRLSPANLIVIFMYISKILSVKFYISQILRYNTDINFSINRLYEIEDKTKFEKEKYGDKFIKKLQGDIEFKNVNFSYKDKLILNNMNLKIKKNTTVGFVGTSGGGKSTIFNLITKLYNVEDNMIFFDNHDINTLTEDTIRNNISIITQNPYIFNMTIKDNLKFINEDIKDEEIKKIAKSCALDEVVNDLEGGYDTLIGENGVILSGGQKQRLAIARALVKNSEIVLFDEATSALDNRTQEVIQKSIYKMSKNKTILIIAHRLSTIINCDIIHFIDKGKIIASGTHEELIKNCKKYQKLYKTEIKK